MTKLYCPKGHETTSTYKNQKAMGLISGIQGFDICWCKDCGDRPYFEIDRLTEPKTVDIGEKMSTESQKCVHVNDTDARIKKDKPYTIVLAYNLIEAKDLYNTDYYGLDGICEFCKKEQVPLQDKILVYETLDKKYNFNKPQEICKECFFEINNQHTPNFKSESQIAVDRVVEALEIAIKVHGLSINKDNILSLITFKNKLKELNK